MECHAYASCKATRDVALPRPAFMRATGIDPKRTSSAARSPLVGHKRLRVGVPGRNVGPIKSIEPTAVGGRLETQVSQTADG